MRRLGTEDDLALGAVGGGTSLDTQERACLDFARQQGWRVVYDPEIVVLAMGGTELVSWQNAVVHSEDPRWTRVGASARSLELGPALRVRETLAQRNQPRTCELALAPDQQAMNTLPLLRITGRVAQHQRLHERRA